MSQDISWHYLHTALYTCDCHALFNLIQVQSPFLCFGINREVAGVRTLRTKGQNSIVVSSREWIVNVLEIEFILSEKGKRNHYIHSKSDPVSIKKLKYYQFLLSDHRPVTANIKTTKLLHVMTSDEIQLVRKNLFLEFL